jgi:15-cis-phytoene synthase
MQQPLPDAPFAHWPADMAACRSHLRDGSRTFYAASFLLPRKVREPASALYAFCRLADDAVDVQGGSFAAVETLRRRLERAYCGKPFDNAIDRAFARTIELTAIPRELPEALIDGLAWDAEGRRYEQFSDLAAYAARVAGTVGAMMAVIMGAREPHVIARATDLGVAMQLTNIARDVGEDARAGRIYLPLSWLRSAGIDPDAWLEHQQFSPALASVVQRLLDAADALYERAESGIAGLPRACRPGIRAARLLYAEIGNELRRGELDSVTRRVFVPTALKLRRLARAATALPLESIEVRAPCLAETRFLAEAVAGSRAPERATLPPRWWDLHGQAVWVIDLFERLQRRCEPPGARLADYALDAERVQVR